MPTSSHPSRHRRMKETFYRKQMTLLDAAETAAHRSFGNDAIFWENVARDVRRVLENFDDEG